MKRATLTILATLLVAACGASPAVADPTTAPTVEITASPEPTLAPVATATPEPVATPEPTVEPTEEPVVEEEETDVTAVALKEWATIGDWSVRVTKVNWNAAKALRKANMFNDKIPKGKVAVMLYVEGKYNGSERVQLDPSFNFRAMGPSMVEYTTFNGDTCGVMPDPNLMLDDPTVRKGGKVKGWGACFVVDKSDVDGLIAFWAPLFGDEDLTGFALR